MTHDELIGKLAEQIEILQLNAELFDDEHPVTTLQMATTIRVLFHDTNNSTSLIKLICDAESKDKNTFEMVSTKEPDDGKTKLVLWGDGLCGMQISSQGFSYIPKLSNSTHTKIPFCDWWKEDVVRNVSGGFENPDWMTRAELIKLHANKEGGAHIDENKNKKIDEIGTNEAAGWIFFAIDSDGVQKEGNCGLDQKKATIRQICYEVLVSLHNHFPELFKREYY